MTEKGPKNPHLKIVHKKDKFEKVPDLPGGGLELDPERILKKELDVKFENLERQKELEKFQAEYLLATTKEEKDDVIFRFGEFLTT